MKNSPATNKRPSTPATAITPTVLEQRAVIAWQRWHGHRSTCSTCSVFGAPLCDRGRSLFALWARSEDRVAITFTSKAGATA